MHRSLPPADLAWVDYVARDRAAPPPPRRERIVLWDDQVAAHPLFTVGDWHVQPALGQIRRGDRVVTVEPRTMRLLLYFAGRAGEVLSVGRLLDEVWPRVLVTPDSVYQAIATLRRALADDSRSPTYIQTLSRRGYRLVAPVRPVADGGSP